MTTPDTNATRSAKPNILYIHSDQHSPQALGCYGDPLRPTPNLDRLAASGIVFRNAYCASPICVASRMAMLTGLHPHQTGVWSNDHTLNSGIPTLAHSLGAAGYRPALSGRMHSIGPDQFHGYAQRFVGDHNPNFLGGKSPPRGPLEGAAGPNFDAIAKSGIGQSAYQPHDEAVTDAALAFLKEHLNSPSGQPFCLTVGYMLPHAPFVARHEDYERYTGRVSLPRIRWSFEDECHPFLRWWRMNGGIEQLSDDLILRCRTAYWALVDRLDAEIGRLLDYLDTQDALENTLVLYTSDHGEMAGEHDLWWKHVFYEQSSRVPLIISWPERLLSGVECKAVVSSQDATATLLDAGEAPPLPNSHGRSLIPLASDTAIERNWDNIAFSEYCNDEAFSPPGGCYQRMIRRDDWKLIYYHEQPCQLFSLSEDPHELSDLSNDKRYRNIRDDLQTELLQNWNPESIRREMTLKRKRNDILQEWGERVQPSPILQWEMTEDMNRLDTTPNIEQSSISSS